MISKLSNFLLGGIVCCICFQIFDFSTLVLGLHRSTLCHQNHKM